MLQATTRLCVERSVRGASWKAFGRGKCDSCA